MCAQCIQMRVRVVRACVCVRGHVDTHNMQRDQRNCHPAQHTPRNPPHPTPPSTAQGGHYQTPHLENQERDGRATTLTHTTSPHIHLTHPRNEPSALSWNHRGRQVLIYSPRLSSHPCFTIATSSIASAVSVCVCVCVSKNLLMGWGPANRFKVQVF